MEIYAPLCSNCNKDAEFVGCSDNNILFSCHPDCLLLKDPEPANSLIVDEKREKCISQLQSLRSKLLKLKSHLLNTAENLTKTINSSLQKSLKSIEQNIFKIDQNSQFVLIKKKLFSPTLNVLEKYEKKDFEPVDNLNFVNNYISKYFDRSLFGFSGLENESLNIEKKFGTNYSLFVNKKLFDDKTSTKKKIKILHEASFFQNIEENSLKSLNENMNMIINSEKIVLDFEHDMVYTLSVDSMSILFWKIQDKIRFYKPVQYKNKIQNIYVVPGSNYRLINFEKFLAVIDVNDLVVNSENMFKFKFKSWDCGAITDFKLFPNKKFIATPAFEGKMKIWEWPNLNPKYDETICNVYFNGSISCFDISSDSESLAIGTLTGQIILYYPFQTSILRVSAHSGGVTFIYFIPKNNNREQNLIVSGGEDSCIKLWKTEDFNIPCFRDKTSKIKRKYFTLSIDFNYILTGCPKCVIIWKILEFSLQKLKIKDKKSLYLYKEIFPDLTRFFKFFR